jgi:hypothetical protein
MDVLRPCNKTDSKISYIIKTWAGRVLETPVLGKRETYRWLLSRVTKVEGQDEGEDCISFENPNSLVGKWLSTVPTVRLRKHRYVIYLTF